MKILIFLLAISAFCLTEPVKYRKVVISDTSKVARMDTLTIIKSTTLTIKDTYKDTVKLLKSDTTKSPLKVDTLKRK